MSVRTFSISLGHSRFDNKPKQSELSWSGICDLLREPIETDETAAEYQAMSKEERGQVKDVGYLVGGSFASGSRLGKDVASRCLIVLDLDHVPANTKLGLSTSLAGYAYSVHSTHSHTKEAPRLRLVLPLTKDIGKDEYAPIARRLAEWVGIDWVDHTSYQPGRIMYLPSHPCDVEPIYHEQTGKFIDPTEILAGYDDWTDPRQWPTASRESSAPRISGEKAEDPTKKVGPIGDFCRANPISIAYLRFLADVYSGDPDEGRLTYTAGSSANGAVIYDDKYIYSHHETDPGYLQLLNSFDWVRVHLFGHLDQDLDKYAPVQEHPSYGAMLELVEADDETAKIRIEKAVEGFESCDLQELAESRIDLLLDKIVSKTELETLEVLPDIVQNITPRGEVTLLAGHGGTGKSFIALVIMILVVLGRPIGDLMTEAVPVLFYSAEDSARVVATRVRSICKALEVPTDEVLNQLHVLDASDIDPVLFRTNPLRLLHDLATVVDRLGAGLIVIDNASDVYDDSEIIRAKVRAFIRALRNKLARPDRGVLLLGHTSKASASGSRATGEDYSGSTAWHNSVRSRLSLKYDSDDQLFLEHQKANYGPLAVNIPFRWFSGVPLPRGSFLANDDWPDGSEIIQQQDDADMQMLFAIIKDFEQRGERVTTATQGPVTTWNLLREIPEFPPGTSKKRFLELIRKMERAKWIRREVVRTPDRKDREVFLPGLTAPISAADTPASTG